MEEKLRRDIFFMRQALAEAHKALERNEIPVGAVVVCGERIVGRGHNMTETLADATAHAEMQAITAASATVGGKYLTECAIYVTIEPCPMCAGALHWSQMGRLVYGAADPKGGYRRFVTADMKSYGRSGAGMLHPKTVVESGILEEECVTLMKDFFRKKRTDV